LQNQPMQVATSAKLQLAQLLAAAGVRSIEATSFVSPKAVPQMADAADLVPLLHAALPAMRTSVLVPNLKGLERAHAAGAQEIAVVLSATETMNRKNINMSLAEATRVSCETLRAARAQGLATRGYLAVAFECPFEGPTPPERVLELGLALVEAGADEIVVADTIGAASPAQVQQLLHRLLPHLPVDRLGLHLHDTRGMGVANAYAGLELGVRRFDASAGGLGGCPFAPGASGNVATEDLVLMAERSGFDTGIALAGLLAAVDFAQDQLQRPLGGRAITWLRRQRDKDQHDNTRRLA
jgi:hydroxymethylglutaryl-CoA lyase